VTQSRELVVRDAMPSDAERIAQIHVGSWQQAYRTLLPDEFLDALSVPRRVELWTGLLAEGRDPPTHVWVVERAGVALGFAHAQTSRDDDAAPGTGEVTSIYLLAEAWGAGAGRALMSEGLAWLGTSGFRVATLWVLEGNQRARRFYEAGGWAVDGARKTEQWGDVEIAEVRYRRDL
jgi:L-amino acid N-acyltransferase YncA